jgi:hypothetical protein
LTVFAKGSHRGRHLAGIAIHGAFDLNQALALREAHHLIPTAEAEFQMQLGAGRLSWRSRQAQTLHGSHYNIEPVTWKDVFRAIDHAGSSQKQSNDQQATG